MEQRKTERYLHQVQPGGTDPEIHSEMEGQGGGGAEVTAGIFIFENLFEQSYTLQLKNKLVYKIIAILYSNAMDLKNTSRYPIFDLQ